MTGPATRPREARAARRTPRWRAAALLSAALLGGPTGPDARAQRLFYHARTWLDTSAAVQRLSLQGVLRGWAEVAAAAEAALDGTPLSRREAEALDLTDCLTRRRPTPLDEIQTRASALARAQPGRAFYSLSDFVAQSLAGLCPPTG